VTFIHQEIYNENDIQKGFKEQVARWRLPTEPWVFLVGRDGRVFERFEGALSVRELKAAVERLKAA
jgi:glutathione peroxidase-family protein